MAMKQLNKRLVVGLGLFGFACMVLLSVLMLRQLQRRDPKYFVALAEAAAGQEQWQQAALFYHEAWERSGDAAFLADVGEMLLREGEVAKAMVAWRQALVQQPSLLPVHERQLALLLELAQLYGNPQRWEQVQDAANTLLGVALDDMPEKQALAHHALGLALINLESRDRANVDRGIAALTAAARLAPGRVDLAIDLARELTRQERVEAAEDLYRKLLDEHSAPGGSGSAAQLAYARHLTERQRFEEAEDFFQRSLKSADNDAEALLEARMGYAQFLMQRWARSMQDEQAKDTAQPLFERAEQILRECVSASPEDFEPSLQMALLYKAAQRHAEVIDTCEKRIHRGLSRKGIEATRNRVSMFTLMIYASEASVALGVKATEPGERDEWLKKAEQYVADARGESPTHPRVLSQAGRVKLARGQDREALRDLRAADEAYGSYDAVNWENKILLAQVHLRLNEAGAAKGVLETVLEQAARYRGRDPIFWNVYAQVLFQNNELERALAISDRVLLVDPANADARQIKAAIYERQGKHELAGQIHEQLTGTPTIRAVLQARAAALAGDVEAAVKVLRDALEHDPGDVRLVAAAVNEMIGLDRREDARGIAERALQDRPHDVRLQKIAVLTRENLTESQRDQATLELIQTGEDALQRELELATFYSRREKLAESVQALDRAEQHIIAKDTPLARSATTIQHSAVLKAKIRVAAQAEDDAAMQAARDAALRYNVDGAGGKSLLGWYHLQRKEYDLALNAYREAVAAQPTDATSMAHLAQCLHMLGRVDEARVTYEESVRVNPNEGVAHQGLAVLAQMRGDRETFRRELAICERLLPTDPWVQEQSLIRSEEADPAEAISRRESRLAQSPEDAYNLQRLAGLYETVGDDEKAEPAYERLMKLSPDDHKVMLVVSAFYRRTNRPQRALEIVTAYADTRTDPAAKHAAMLLIANEYVQQRSFVEAERLLLSAYEGAGTMETAHALAEFYMRALNAPGKAVAWYARAVEHARSTKSAQLPSLLDAKISCLLHRSINDLDQAGRDVAELRQEHPSVVRGLLWQSEIAARRGDIDEAVTALNEYLDRRPNDTYALYQRARHHLARGRNVAAMADLEAIKRSSPLSLELQPRLLLARLQQRSGRRDLWLAELESLAKDAPDSFAAIEALAAAYLEEKRLTDAERLVTAQINRSEPTPPARWYFLRGRILLASQDAERALSDYRRGAEVSDFTAESVQQALNAYVQLGRFAEGVQYFERYVNDARLTSAPVSRYAQLLVRSGAKAKAVEQFRRAMGLALGEEPSAAQAVGNDVLAAFDATELVAAFSAQPPTGLPGRANERILVRALAATGRAADAASRLNALFATAADDRERAALLHEKGDIYQVAGQSDRAIESYQAALEYDADNWILLNNVAYLLSDARGASEAALAYAQKAVGREDNAFTLDTLGWIYAGLGRYGPAIAELSRAVRVNPDYALSYYHLGESYRRSSRFVEAADVLKDGQVVIRNTRDQELMKLMETALEKTSRRDATP
jgi:tetratricopeptide (TPR) repeat protein